MEYYLQKDRLQKYEGEIEDLDSLTDAQLEAKAEIDKAFDEVLKFKRILFEKSRGFFKILLIKIIWDDIIIILIVMKIRTWL